jgi:sarcosine oxidase subunit alpha
MCGLIRTPSLVARAKELGIEVLAGQSVLDTSGSLRIKSMKVGRVSGGSTRDIAVDALIMSAGWTPSVHMYSQSRGKVVWDEETSRFLPGRNVQACASVGACKGVDDLGDAIADARTKAGLSRPRNPPGIKTRSRRKAPEAEAGTSWDGSMMGSAGGAGPDTTVKAFVDFQNDVTAKDIRLAVREGMHSIEHVKRFTTNGMATDQGKTSNIHGLAIAAEMLGKPLPQVGLTTFRSPYTPVTFGAIVNHSRGDLFDPTRCTPIHDWEVAHGAVFEDVGQWKRAWYYPRAGEDMHEAVNRECRTVREVAGMFDASTLGKIEVVGPDAAKFLRSDVHKRLGQAGPGSLQIRHHAARGWLHL